MSRRRYRYDPEIKECVEIGADYVLAERRAPVASEASTYGHLGRATDGTPIDTRSKHRSYMKDNGLALTSDFTQTHAAGEEARRRARAGDFGQADSRSHRETIERVFHHLSSRRSRRG